MASCSCSEALAGFSSSRAIFPARACDEASFGSSRRASVIACQTSSLPCDHVIQDQFRCLLHEVLCLFILVVFEQEQRRPESHISPLRLHAYTRVQSLHVILQSSHGIGALIL